MPVYEFRCESCYNHIDKNMKMSESNTKYIECPCGSTAIRVPSKSSFELTGGGWAGSGYSKGE